MRAVEGWWRSCSLITVCLLVSLIFPALSAVAAETVPEETSGIESAQSQSPEQTLAQLSDEQVRRLLLDELRAKSEEENLTSPGHMRGPAHLLSSTLSTLSKEHDENEDQYRKLFGSIPHVLPDLYKVFITLCPYGTSEGAMLNIIWVICFIVSGLIVELLFRSLIISRYFQKSPETDGADLSSLDRLLSGITQRLPEIIGLLVFFGSAYFAFMIMIWTDSPYVQLFFLASLIVVTAIRTIAIVCRILLSPSQPYLRVLPLSDQVSKQTYRLVLWTVGYITTALMFAVISRRLGAQLETVRLLQLLFASLLLTVTGVAALIYRTQVRDVILESGTSDNQALTWGRQQFASIWHILAIAYLAVLGFLLINDLADPTNRNSGAFLLSFFVVPIWMVVDRIIQWVVGYSMKTLRIHQDQYDDDTEPTPEDVVQREKGRLLYLKFKGISRIGVVGVMIIWVASLWNIRIPLFSHLASVLLDTIIILTVALFFWQFISSWIERKIQESIPEEEDDSKEDDEWGGAANRGRAYTLLPMIRKFIGSVLTVMVTMTLLSSMGVDIGPLLAGAGVIGLAIGFGAQKLVADIFSGFFYLLDDAFRVGEYLTAGSVSGTVENITLRNVMLRHHRGMLQIIPHSELGAITNYMRGGIIVKFNLDFPYDAPIDKIRKVIKKVGQKMLENEEYGKDFIKPVKSQGVREISNSVMTIRVKFTAQPGTHFVIRREAYRLITEALNAQGIYYAHRKVIVDVPEIPDAEENRITEHQQIINKAAGAAALRAIEEEEQQNGENKSDDEMMGG